MSPRFVVRKSDDRDVVNRTKDFTWDVVDLGRSKDHPCVVENCDTRAEARRRAREYNQEAPDFGNAYHRQ